MSKKFGKMKPGRKAGLQGELGDPAAVVLVKLHLLEVSSFNF